MRFGPNLKRFLPRTLFARTILIILLPLIVAQLVAGWVFYDRHYQSVTFRLAQTIAGDVLLLLDQIDTTPRQNWGELFTNYRHATGLDVTYVQRSNDQGVSASDMRRQSLTEALEQRGIKDFLFGANDDNWVVLYVSLPTAEVDYLNIRIPMRRLDTPKTGVFLGWMVGAAALLVLVSLIFMRNQIRPIHRLAEAAERFGRTMETGAFKLEGAREVRQAAAAFLVMRNRLRRMIEQRTTMLAAISHDLRTPLTRLRLSLALLPAGTDIADMETDIAEMEQMIEAYLSFARGEDSEPVAEVDLQALLADIAAKAANFGKPVWWQAEDNITLPGRREALRRAITNLVSNALKYGNAIWITLSLADLMIEISIEDDGPGISADRRERAFKPFSQLDKGKDATDEIIQGAVDISSKSYGLGLTIARDIARAHGGDVVLGDSPHGGLKATLRLPV